MDNIRDLESFDLNENDSIEKFNEWVKGAPICARCLCYKYKIVNKIAIYNPASSCFS